eukprot:gene38413-46682_t
MSEGVVAALSALSVMVIIYDGKWRGEQFHPDKYSSKVYDWFEGTGTVVGFKRNRVFILSSIHCNPTSTYTFFVKGDITRQVQVNATLLVNCFVQENNGIDVAVFSCDISGFVEETLNSYLGYIRWHTPESIPAKSKVTLVHYPTSVPAAAATEESSETLEYDATYRLFNPVYPTITYGEVVSHSPETSTFDSTIIATGGSSGGILVDEHGRCLGVHDSQHNENPLLPDTL